MAKKKTAKWKTGTRIRHATEPDMRGMILTVSFDGTDAQVQWDGGIAQWVDIVDLREAGYVL